MKRACLAGAIVLALLIGAHPSPSAAPQLVYARVPTRTPGTPLPTTPPIVSTPAPYPPPYPAPANAAVRAPLRHTYIPAVIR